MTRSTTRRLFEPLDEPEREIPRRRKVDRRHPPTESLNIVGRNLFNDGESSSGNVKPAITPDKRKFSQFVNFKFASLHEDKGWDHIEEFVQYQEDSWDDPLSHEYASFASELTKPTIVDRLKRAHQQLSYLTTPTREKSLKNTYLICDICGGAHEADECDQNVSHEQVFTTLRRKTSPSDPALAITTRYGTTTRDPLYPASHTSPLPHEQANNDENKSKEPPAMIHMPKGAKVLKDLLSHNEKLKKAASLVQLSEECSVVIQNGLPQKGDPRSFTLPCLIGPLAVKNALADLGASINLMPYFLFCKLGIPELKPTKMSIQLADRPFKYLIGRPFLATTRAVIDIHDERMSMRVSKETVTFNFRKLTRGKQPHSDYLYYANHAVKFIHDQWMDTVHLDEKWVETVQNLEKDQALSFHPRHEVKPLEWRAPKNSLKPSIKEPPKLELKELPKHLEYAFLQGDDQLPIVISSSLSKDEKSKLLNVLRNHKRAIAWGIADIKGIDSSFRTYKILLEDEYKPTVQP
nr:hypothetical protein [Tanacetum cinerariifolium]